MNKPKTWLQKLSNACYHEKLIFLSLILVLTTLSFDCWLKNLPISGYALVVTTLVLIGCTTWATCHAIKWLLHCNKPLKVYITEKSQNEKLKSILRIISNKEDAIFDKVLQTKTNHFGLFSYPTTLNEQVRLLLKDTERDFVKPWYSEISQNPSFLFDTHLLLEEILFKIIEKLKNVNYKNLILRILTLYLNHLQEYKKSVKKMAKLKIVENSVDKCNENKETKKCDETSEQNQEKFDMMDVYRYIHPGSQNEQILNYYLKKVTKWLLQEYSPQDFVVSVQCKILTNIIAKQLLRAGLTLLEDPNWIYIKIINVIDSSKYSELLKNKLYIVKEKVVKSPGDTNEFQFKQSAMLTKRYMKSNLFEKSSDFFAITEFNKEQTIKSNDGEVQRKSVKKTEKENLNLPLNYNHQFFEERGNHISSVLSGVISSTAGPLLPENMSVCYQPLNKMWQSPISEKRKELVEPQAMPYGKTIVDGVKIETRHSSKTKRLPRSKSTDSVSPVGDVNDSLKLKDISIGEELCENVRFTSKEDVNNETRSGKNGNIKKLVKTRSFDSGSIAIESMSMDLAFEADLEENQGVFRSDNEAGNVSPVYEESEDFATTIAKLRSLLQQRESGSTLSDKSGHSIDLPSNNTSFAEPSDSSCKTQLTDLENSSFDSQVSSDVPTDGRLFTNVCIPKTELLTDSSGSPYVLYSVQYDAIYMLKDQSSSDEPELVLQTTIVKRRFQEFLNLQYRLEECNHLKSAMKGVRGPAKWLNLPFSNKTDDSTTTNRKSVLEAFLQQLCSKAETSAAPELHEFLAYGQTESKMFVKKDSEFSIRRIDKLLTNKVTDVFNSIKTVLPSFDFDSSASIAVSDSTKGAQDQKLLPGFLNFSNKTEDFEVNLNFVFREPTGESLADDIRLYLKRKTDGVEDGTDVLDSSDWLAEKRECRPTSSEGKCVWRGYKDLFDDDMDRLDSWLPIYSMVLDILCELLEASDCWMTKEPVIRLIKVLTGHWESKIQEWLSKCDWDQIMANVIRLLRSVAFQPASSQLPEEIELDLESTKIFLKELIQSLIPNYISKFFKSDGISSAIALFVDSFQNFRANRDVLLRLADILLVQLLSCHHVTCDIT